MRALAIAALLAGLAAPGAFADGSAAPESASLEIAGAVAKPATITAGDLAKLAPVTVPITFQTGHGEETGRFTGVPLWTLLERAGLADAQGNHPDIRHAFAAIGRDGYTVVLAFGEIDPEFEGKQVIVAYRREDGTAPIGGLRLIVPGDKRGGRSVRDLVRIEVR